MRTLFFAVLITGIFRTPLNSSRILSMSCCLFILFFSDAFCKLLLRSFSRSLRFSASLSKHSSFSNTLALLLLWNTIEPASSTWCGTCAPRCSSELRSGCSSPSGRCFGSRSPARKSQLPLQLFLISTPCASSSPPILTSGCGSWFCSRSPAVLSRSLHFFSGV